MKRKWTLIILFGAAACGGGTTENNNGNNNGNGNYPGDPGGSPVQAATVEVRDNQYVPNSVVVAVGGTVTFQWIGTAGHSVTPGSGSTFSPTAGISYPPKELTVTFSTAGTYNYYCIIHGASDGYGGQGSMIGTVTVR
jgi:plastocyanin